MATTKPRWKTYVSAWQGDKQIEIQRSGNAKSGYVYQKYMTEITNPYNIEGPLDEVIKEITRIASAVPNGYVNIAASTRDSYGDSWAELSIGISGWVDITEAEAEKIANDVRLAEAERKAQEASYAIGQINRLKREHPELF